MLMLGKFLSNVYDPYKPDAELLHPYSFEDFQNGPEALKAAWQSYLRWINSNVIGPPKATDHYTEDQLIEIGMVGVYAPPFDLKIEK